MIADQKVMHKTISFMLILAVTVMDLWPSNLSPNRAEAIAPVVVIPAAAIGALDLAAMTAAAAAAMGAITVVQNEDIQRQISGLIDEIETKTGEALSAAVTNAQIFLRKISGRGATCDPKAATPARNRAAACTESPEKCCPDYLDKIVGRYERRSGGYKIFKNSRFNKFLCCLEWDSLHGTFEIFDGRGKHLGERLCDDLSDDPCSRTKTDSKHTEVEKAFHLPRSLICGNKN